VRCARLADLAIRVNKKIAEFTDAIIKPEWVGPAGHSGLVLIDPFRRRIIPRAMPNSYNWVNWLVQVPTAIESDHPPQMPPVITAMGILMGMGMEPK